MLFCPMVNNTPPWNFHSKILNEDFPQILIPLIFKFFIIPGLPCCMYKLLSLVETKQEAEDVEHLTPDQQYAIIMLTITQENYQH